MSINLSYNIKKLKVVFYKTENKIEEYIFYMFWI